MHLIVLQFRRLALAFLFLLVIGSSAFAQEGTTNPISNDEFVQRLYQLPKHPGMMVQLVDDIRHRGIGFPLTDGLKSLVATKSGNDPVLRRTLEEASRRRENPVSAKLPPEAEAVDLLAR